MTAFNSTLTASNIRIMAERIEFAQALKNTTDPKYAAMGVATYRRLTQRAKEVVQTLSEEETRQLTEAACMEVAFRLHARKESHALKLERMRELAEMREEMTFSK